MNPLAPKPRADTHLWIPLGRQGTVDTLNVMAAVVAQSINEPIVLNFAHRVCRDTELAPATLDNWMRRFWDPQPDPDGIELIKLPEFRLAEMDFSGDCDDASVFAAAVLGCVPRISEFWSCSYLAIRMPGNQEFSHVWLRCTRRDGATVDIDPIVPESDMPVRGYEEVLERLLF